MVGIIRIDIHNLPKKILFACFAKNGGTSDQLKIIFRKLEIFQTISIKKKYFAHFFAHSRKFLG